MLRIALLLTGSVLILSGCGGGSSSSPAPIEPTPPVVEEGTPTIVVGLLPLEWQSIQVNAGEIRDLERVDSTLFALNGDGVWLSPIESIEWTPTGSFTSEMSAVSDQFVVLNNGTRINAAGELQSSGFNGQFQYASATDVLYNVSGDTPSEIAQSFDQGLSFSPLVELPGSILSFSVSIDAQMIYALTRSEIGQFAVYSIELPTTNVEKIADTNRFERIIVDNSDRIFLTRTGEILGILELPFSEIKELPSQSFGIPGSIEILERDTAGNVVFAIANSVFNLDLNLELINEVVINQASQILAAENYDQTVFYGARNGVFVETLNQEAVNVGIPGNYITSVSSLNDTAVLVARGSVSSLQLYKYDPQISPKPSLLNPNLTLDIKGFIETSSDEILAYGSVPLEQNLSFVGQFDNILHQITSSTLITGNIQNVARDSDGNLVAHIIDSAHKNSLLVSRDDGVTFNDLETEVSSINQACNAAIANASNSLFEIDVDANSSLIDINIPSMAVFEESGRIFNYHNGVIEELTTCESYTSVFSLKVPESINNIEHISAPNDDSLVLYDSATEELWEVDVTKNEWQRAQLPEQIEGSVTSVNFVAGELYITTSANQVFSVSF